MVGGSAAIMDDTDHLHRLLASEPLDEQPHPCPKCGVGTMQADLCPMCEPEPQTAAYPKGRWTTEEPK